MSGNSALMESRDELDALRDDLLSESHERILRAAARIPILMARERGSRRRAMALGMLISAHNRIISKARGLIPSSDEIIRRNIGNDRIKRITMDVVPHLKDARGIRQAIEKLGYLVPSEFDVVELRPDASTKLLIPRELSTEQLRPILARARRSIPTITKGKEPLAEEKPPLARVPERLPEQKAPRPLEQPSLSDLEKALEAQLVEDFGKRIPRKGFARSVPEPPEPFAFDLSGNVDIRPLDPWIEQKRQRGQEISPVMQYLHQRARRYRFLSPFEGMLLFVVDVPAAVRDLLIIYMDKLVDPLLKHLEGGSRIQREYQRNRAERLEEMRQALPKAFRSGAISERVMETYFSEADLVGLDDRIFLWRIVQNTANTLKSRVLALDKLGGTWAAIKDDEDMSKEHIAMLGSLLEDGRQDMRLRVVAAHNLLRTGREDARGMVRKTRLYVAALCFRAQVDGHKPSIKELRGILRSKEYDGDEKATAASALMAMGDEAGLRMIMGTLRKGDPRLKDLAFSSLTALGWREDVQAGMMANLDDPDPAIRVSAILALQGGESRKVVDALAKRLSDSDFGVRISAAMALGEIAFNAGASPEDARMKVGKAAEARLNGLYKRGGDGRIIASLGLAALEDGRAASEILRGVSSRDRQLRLACAGSIPLLVKRGMLSDEKAKRALLALRRDDSQEMSLLAASALKWLARAQSR